MRFIRIATFLFTSLIISLLQSCDPKVKPSVKVPETYDFTRNGSTTVSFSGQTDRLNQLSEMKSYFQEGDAGAQLEAVVFQDMFENIDGDGAGSFTFTSDRQLKDKTFASDIAFFENLFESAEAASNSTSEASPGVAGLIERSSGNTILLDANGHEFTQTFEKGIMGSVFLHQIYNVYMTDARIGDNVENTVLDGTNNYTLMEHHWDEAFGYFGVPVDFPVTKSNRFWGNYCNGRDALLGTNALLMDAFKTGRAAIVAKRYDVKNKQREIIYNGFELIAAATAVHYLNGVKEAFTLEAWGDGLHELTEGYMFIKALRLSPYKKITDAQLDQILETDIGEDFWEVAGSDFSGIDQAITTLVTAYPELQPLKNLL